MPTRPSASYFVGSLIASLVGAVMLLTSDFAGWESRVLIDQEILLYSSSGGTIGFLESPLYFLLIGSFAALLLYGAFVSYQGLRSGDTPFPRRRLELGFYGGAIVAAGSLLGGLIFFVSMMSEDPQDSWLDAGFYAGVISGGLTALFFRLALRSATTS